jgi:uncharacterized protein YebE (UPF0316 family)
MALGLLEVSVYKHTEPGKILADQLRTAGYSVTTTIGYGWEGKQRLILNVILPRKQFPELQDILAGHGKVNMSVKAVSKTYGKLGSQRALHGS